MKKTRIAALFVFAFLLTGCSQKIIGGEKDSHGCLIGAGYSWCDEKQKCMRIWEENCTIENVTASNTTLMVLTEYDAIAAANSSVCMIEGNVSGKPLYSEKQGIWWVPINYTKKKMEGCTALCAVEKEGGAARTVWSCSGPLPYLLD